VLLNNIIIKINAMIDISDGLASELIHICRQSGKGCEIHHDRIPVLEDTKKAAQELELEPLICALHGGEDYELLFTVPLSEYEQIKDLNEISIIGNITGTGEKAVIHTSDGSAAELIAQGWDSDIE
jgi:thiamine-monophosphate kinase